MWALMGVDTHREPQLAMGIKRQWEDSVKNQVIRGLVEGGHRANGLLFGDHRARRWVRCRGGVRRDKVLGARESGRRSPSRGYTQDVGTG